MDRVWRALPVAPHSAVPPLLVATTFGATSYSVAVTDLARVWSESLDRRGICMRAFQENTTIDPSYDGEQMGVFLDKIKGAFGSIGSVGGSVGSARGVDDAYSLCLAAAGDDGDDLVLHITCTLPGDLPPLKWPMRLALSSASSASSSSSGSSLVQPLLRDRARRQRSTAALVAALRQKDAVIAKLVDKLDAMGAGAESAFPSLLPSGGGGGAGARRTGGRTSRADMERRIKGLAPFDEAAFWKQLDEAPSGDMASVMSSFGELPCGEDDGVGVAGSEWWHSLGTGTGVELARTTSELSDGRKSPQSGGQGGNQTDSAADDEFQTSPVQAGKTAAHAPSPTPARTEPAKKGLGRIGGKKATPAKVDKQPVVPPLPTNADDETASEADEPAETSQAKSSQETAAGTAAETAAETVAERPRSARGGLGRIGGKKETTKAEPSSSKPVTAEPEPEEAPKTVEEKPPAPKPNAGLGRIGKGAIKADKKDKNESDDSGKRKADTTESPAPPLAEAKRAEVLQQAVAKNAAPVRKKRKF